MSAEQRTPEWFAERCGHATASRATDVLAEGKSGEAVTRRDYRVELVCERLTGKPVEDTYTNKHMDRGTELEPMARALYMDRRDTLVSQLGFVKHPRITWVGASPDSEKENRRGGLEIKCPKAAIHVDTLTRGMPAGHRKQIQWQLWCKPEWEDVDFVSFNNELPEHLQLYIETIPRDVKFIAEVIVPKAIQFLAEVEETYQKLLKVRL